MPVLVSFLFTWVIFSGINRTNKVEFIQKIKASPSRKIVPFGSLAECRVPFVHFCNSAPEIWLGRQLLAFALGISYKTVLSYLPNSLYNERKVQIAEPPTPLVASPKYNEIQVYSFSSLDNYVFGASGGLFGKYSHFMGSITIPSNESGAALARMAIELCLRRTNEEERHGFMENHLPVLIKLLGPAFRKGVWEVLLAAALVKKPHIQRLNAVARQDFTKWDSILRNAGQCILTLPSYLYDILQSFLGFGIDGDSGDLTLTIERHTLRVSSLLPLEASCSLDGKPAEIEAAPAAIQEVWNALLILAPSTRMFLACLGASFGFKGYLWKPSFPLLHAKINQSNALDSVHRQSAADPASDPVWIQAGKDLKQLLSDIRTGKIDDFDL